MTLALTINLTYFDSKTYEEYIASVYNGTVTIMEPPQTWDLQLCSLYVIGGAIVVAAGWTLQRAFITSKKKPALKTRGGSSISSSSTATKKKTTPSTEPVTISEIPPDLDWIPGHLRSETSRSRKA
jgi:hypothetical protein